MDQVRAAARHLIGADSPIYKKFDEAVWREEVVVKMAATPLTALLLSAFFQAYEKFEQRFSMNDLLLKFILLKVWENVKSGAFPFKNLELFFQEVKKAGFSEKHPETQVLYDALASICFQLFYGGKDGKVHRSVNEETLKQAFDLFIRNYLHYNEKETAITEEEWFEQLKQDHLLLQAGAGEYVFIHAAVMEYMAAYYLMQQYQGEKNRFNEILKSCLKKKELFDLETIPIASGSSLVIGFEILAVLRGLNLEPKLEPLHDRIVEMGFKCLAEVEWLLEKTLQGIRVESLKSHILNIVQKNRDYSDWVYAFLKQRVLGEDKNNLSQDIQYFDAFEKLSRNIFLEEYLDYNAFDQGDSELVVLRKQLLGKLVQKEIVEKWLKDKEQTEIFDNVLQLDTPGYHPEDKNFNYYRELIGKELRGFFGSPNLRHSKSIRACAVTPDGKRVVSASDDSTLKMWELESGKEIRTFTGHQDYVRHCAITPDGKWVVSASDDKTLKLWELES
ncbi:MAG TPA: WD40 repeat domain-containing protein, partial [Candidatus Kapabacteria bacterium]|nr:WD40 repeat domain-containing protein [Candidatus Kapabacteria bacterium]